MFFRYIRNIQHDTCFGVLEFPHHEPYQLYIIENPNYLISPGTYDINFSYSQKFKTWLPYLNVPGRSGIRIHCGNKPSDSHGCLLVGRSISADGKLLTKSREALSDFLGYILANNVRTIVIQNSLL